MYVEHYDTTANTTLNITLPVESYSILVKNLTNAELRITLNGKYNNKNFIFLPANYCQEIYINKRPELEYKIKSISISPESSQTLGVEVQCLTF